MAAMKAPNRATRGMPLLSDGLRRLRPGQEYLLPGFPLELAPVAHIIDRLKAPKCLEPHWSRTTSYVQVHRLLTRLLIRFHYTHTHSHTNTTLCIPQTSTGLLDFC